ncbi:uncharacterized protein M421DRAFT_357989 [Didymella exigua CBS 183.55]|uniref:Uncharacterized protein n=1 Tax=Didymella exigua CBS 183.55 TaxID=1150837 RepID=A0A6A5RZQ8_9PLEO|nr:uncharacterized protein M421DRAFT_357989 [Didymella exigua CBS 183.55]KAF1930747.1 hypothetical protein M421DRAFT_357989 [Didymella exigua CBS 183.55]
MCRHYRFDQLLDEPSRRANDGGCARFRTRDRYVLSRRRTATVLALSSPISTSLASTRNAEKEEVGPEVAICTCADRQLRPKHVGELTINHSNFDKLLACSIC